ncbi:MAG: Crp/Fnr family transcriptional regulator [Calditrichaeota bacterium]|nr:Crp/Fnr family transcriptional regulator [Calditrichota bacterium]
MERVQILERFHFFRQADARHREEILNAAACTSLPAGKLLFLEGDRCRQIVLLGSGDIRIFKGSPAGREITLYHVQAGEGCVLNIACALGDGVYPAMAMVESDAEAVFFSAEHFRRWSNKPFFNDFVFELLSRRLVDVIMLLEDVAFQKMDQRLAEFLYQRFNNARYPRRVLRMTHEQIASELGTAREVVSRLIKVFDRSGAVVQARGRIILQDEKLLKSFCVPQAG